MAGSQPIIVDVVHDDKKDAKPAAPVSQPKPSTQAAATTQSKLDAKEEEKLQKMKEIQDTVKALRKQMEDIDKKDREESMKSPKKNDDDEEDDASVLIKQKESGLQILTDEPKPAAAKASGNSTAQVSSAAKTNASAAADQAAKEKAGKFERFVKARKQKQEAAKNMTQMADY